MGHPVYVYNLFLNTWDIKCRHPTMSLPTLVFNQFGVNLDNSNTRVPSSVQLKGLEQEDLKTEKKSISKYDHFGPNNEHFVSEIFPLFYNKHSFDLSVGLSKKNYCKQ